MTPSSQDSTSSTTPSGRGTSPFAALAFVAALLGAIVGIQLWRQRIHTAHSLDRLESFSADFEASCSAATASINFTCVTSYAAVACGADAQGAFLPGFTHLDLLDPATNTLTNAVVADVDAEAAARDGGRVCLAPDIDLSPLTMRGYWDGWEKRASTVAPGVGLFATRALPRGTCLGRVARVYYPRYFNDWPAIAVINHGEASNVDFIAVPDYALEIVHLFGRVTRAVAAGEEMLADYRSARCPRPNFIDPTESPIYGYFFGREGGNGGQEGVVGDRGDGKRGEL